MGGWVVESVRDRRGRGAGRAKRDGPTKGRDARTGAYLVVNRLGLLVHHREAGARVDVVGEEVGAQRGDEALGPAQEDLQQAVLFRLDLLAHLDQIFARALARRHQLEVLEVLGGEHREDRPDVVPLRERDRVDRVLEVEPREERRGRQRGRRLGHRPVRGRGRSGTSASRHERDLSDLSEEIPLRGQTLQVDDWMNPKGAGRESESESESVCESKRERE